MLKLLYDFKINIRMQRSFQFNVNYLCDVSYVQKQMKKKLIALTREHEALFNFVENNKQICTEKEKQKVGHTRSTLFSLQYSWILS